MKLEPPKEEPKWDIKKSTYNATAADNNNNNNSDDNNNNNAAVVAPDELPFALLAEMQMDVSKVRRSLRDQIHNTHGECSS